ncbi:MAG TPA: translation initiation factor IF-2 [Oscillatoriales cyanobacterium M59_W2019_021]|nr:translation initiation factor IF-2 [Oscillatoriales cyanobacterium M59_W2019_021]
MNNGKVRIYELSRELNLDNKEILTICEQLNIAVKSHSSTITEDDANRIRSAAPAHIASSSPLPNSSDSSKPQKTQSPQPPSRPSKPQIVTVKPQPRPVPSLSSPKPSSPESPSTPDTGNVPAVASAPKRPIEPTPKKPEESGNRSAHAPAAEVTAPRPTEPTPQKSPTPSAPPAKETRKTLLGPPSRATAASPESQKPGSQKSSATSDRVSRPILKTPKADRPVESSSGEKSTRSSSKPTPARSGETAKPQPRKSGERQPTPSLAGPPQRPQLVRLDKAKATDGDIDDEVEKTPVEVEETEDEIALNPKPSRPVKRTSKKRKNEDEDLGELGAKAAKTKSKRWMTIDDDDEDLDGDLLEDGDANPQLSLSLARPPKAAKRSAPSKPSTISQSRPKKATSRGEGGSTSRDRDRRSGTAVKEKPQKLVLTGNLTLRELADTLVIPETEIIKKLFLKGIPVNVTQTLDVPTATLVAEEFGIEVETAEAESEARKSTEMLDADDLENLQPRPPVVTIMGHVDHGKTTLLDTIRQSKVAQGEAGGITQHTGAYHVDVEREGKMKQIVFLDTPGHEAFTAMRARGARVTDIAVLVVAADDGVRPQTIEAIGHAKAAEVPIVVAINKIDKEEAQPDRVKQELTEYGLVPEEWGGETIMVPVSAIQGENLDTLLEMLLLVAEIEELSANPDRPAKGTIIEAHLDKAKGAVATFLVQNGTLRVGDVFVAGPVLGKVRAMVDDRGQRVEEATPSFPVEVLGLSDVPAAGDEFEVYPNEKEARAIADRRLQEQRQDRLRVAMASRRVTLSSLSEAKREGQLKELNLILKADVQGSVEAIVGSLKQLPQEEVQVRLLLAAPGEVTETDVDLAAASEAVIISFNTTLATGARQAAEREGVDVREYNIIYQLLDDIQGAMEGLLEPELVEEPLGEAEVRALFPVGRGVVAGCYVLSGKMVRNCKTRVLRDGQVVHEGILDSLKRMRDDVKEVNTGYECGIALDNFNAWKEGDRISAYRMVTKRRTLTR